MGSGADIRGGSSGSIRKPHSGSGGAVWWAGTHRRPAGWTAARSRTGRSAPAAGRGCRAHASCCAPAGRGRARGGAEEGGRRVFRGGQLLVGTPPLGCWVGEAHGAGSCLIALSGGSNVRQQPPTAGHSCRPPGCASPAHLHEVLEAPLRRKVGFCPAVEHVHQGDVVPCRGRGVAGWQGGGQGMRRMVAGASRWPGLPPPLLGLIASQFGICMHPHAGQAARQAWRGAGGGPPTPPRWKALCALSACTALSLGR